MSQQAFMQSPFWGAGLGDRGQLRPLQQGAQKVIGHRQMALPIHAQQ
jgi:hypothetical protein